MLRNDFKLTKAVSLPSSGVTNILCTRKQKFIFPKSKSSPQVITKIAKVAGIQPKSQISDAVKLVPLLNWEKTFFKQILLKIMLFLQ